MIKRNFSLFSKCSPMLFTKFVNPIKLYRDHNKPKPHFLKLFRFF